MSRFNEAEQLRFYQAVHKAFVGVRNNLFLTTKALREHHAKQRKNAFHHIQAISLPFQNMEFYWQRFSSSGYF
jgi:hypothetical protein